MSSTLTQVSQSAITQPATYKTTGQQAAKATATTKNNHHKQTLKRSTDESYSI